MQDIFRIIFLDKVCKILMVELKNDKRYDSQGFNGAGLFSVVFAASFSGFVSAYIHSFRLFACECGGLCDLCSRIALGGLHPASPGKVVRMP